MLCLAMATCYGNDIYREAAKRGIEVIGVEVQSNAEFDAEGGPAKHLPKIHPSRRVVASIRAVPAC